MWFFDNLHIISFSRSFHGFVPYSIPVMEKQCSSSLLVIVVVIPSQYHHPPPVFAHPSMVHFVRPQLTSWPPWQLTQSVAAFLCARYRWYRQTHTPAAHNSGLLLGGHTADPAVLYQDQDLDDCVFLSHLKVVRSEPHMAPCFYLRLHQWPHGPTQGHYPKIVITLSWLLRRWFP